MRRDVFQAIADPTRREIINLISRKSLNLNSIADNFSVSRPAISQHIKILEECGLVQVESLGRERICTPQLDRLKEVHLWTEQFKVFWSKKLDALGMFLDHEAEQLRKAKRKNSKPLKKKKE
jgi:DNA-binding transcriptional ArsR family regulator